MIKDIILNLEYDKARDGVRDYAISLAEAFNAHLAGIARAGGASIPSYLISDFPADALEDLLIEQEEAAREAVARFEAAAKRSLISAEHRFIERSAFSPPDIFAAMARRFDLSVIMQSDEGNGAYNDLLIEAVLFDSGRPMIVTPYIQKDGFKLDRVVCCWDGSRSATRAINDALPLLKKAGTIELLIVTNEKAKGERLVHGADIGNHLARHGLKVEVETVPATDHDVANVVLSHMADRAANMIVMGGYGHSRLREFVLGGVTRGILSSMTVPVFMSH